MSNPMRAMAEEYGNRADSETETCACGECPSPLAHTRREYHRADRWGRRMAAEEEVTDDGSSWGESSIADAEDLPPRTLLEVGAGTHLVRLGEVATIFGASGSAKTPLAYIGGAQVVKDGGLWVLIDYEMGWSMAKSLLLELGLSRAEIDHGIFGVENPAMLNDVGMQRFLDEVVSKADRTGRDLRYVTWDSQNRSMATTPFPNSSDNTDVNRWFTTHPNRVRSEIQSNGFQAGHVVIDHTNNDDSGRPGGAHSKTDSVDTQIHVKNHTPFDRTHENGHSDIILVKIRGGDLPKGPPLAEIRTRMGGSFYTATPSAPGSVTLNLGGAEPKRKSKAEWDMTVQTALCDARGEGIAQSKLLGGGSGRDPRVEALGRLFDGGRAARKVTSIGIRWWDIAVAPADAESKPRPS